MRSKFFKLNAGDFLKGLLVAVITALLTGLYEIIQAGGDLTWLTFKPVLLASIGAGIAYLLKNLFTNSLGGFAKNEKGSAPSFGITRIILIGIILSVSGLIASGQHPIPRETAKKKGPWSGFFRPVGSDIFAGNYKAPGEGSSVWKFRPTVEISALQLIPTKESGKVFDVSAFQSVGMGVSYQHFINYGGNPYNNYGFNVLVLFDQIPRETIAINISPTVSFSVFEFLTFGAGYNFGLKKFFMITGIVYNFN